MASLGLLVSVLLAWGMQLLGKNLKRLKRPCVFIGIASLWTEDLQAVNMHNFNKLQSHPGTLP